MVRLFCVTPAALHIRPANSLSSGKHTMPVLEDLITDKLIYVWRNALSSRNLSPEKLEGTSHITLLNSIKGVRIDLTYDGIRTLQQLIHGILKEPRIAAKFSRRYLETKVKDALLDLVAVPEREISTHARKAAQSLVMLTQQEPSKWIILVPISNLKLDMDGLKIGHVVFGTANRLLENAFASTNFTQDRIRDEFQFMKDSWGSLDLPVAQTTTFDARIQAWDGLLTFLERITRVIQRRSLS